MTTVMSPALQAAAHYDSGYYQAGPRHDARYHILQRVPLFAPHIGPEDRVLDFGCSDGGVLCQLPGRIKAGVEINPCSRQLARGKGLDVRPALSDFAGATFTRIISGHCLEHVTDPAGTLSELRSLVEPQGRLVLNLPLNDCRDRRQRDWKSGDENMHLYAWTPLTLGNLLWVSGWQPREIRVLRKTYPRRFGQRIAEFSPYLYDLLAQVYGRIRPRHQLLAVACPR